MLKEMCKNIQKHLKTTQDCKYLSDLNDYDINWSVATLWYTILSNKLTMFQQNQTHWFFSTAQARGITRSQAYTYW